MISFAMSEIIALVIEAFAYGMYLILFFASLSVAHTRRREKRGFNYKFLGTSLLLFVLISWHLAMDSVMLFLAYNHETTLEADLFYARGIPGVLNVMKTGVYVAVTLVSDAFMLYRCFVVWNRSIPIIILPGLLFLADIATGVAGLWVLTRSVDSFFTESQLRVTSSFFGVTMATNSLATALIAFRVWRGQREMRGITTMSSLNNLLAVILESGVIYSIMLILVLATFAGKSTAAFNVFIDVTSPVIGIVFSLIIVRVGLNLSVKSDGRPQDNNSTLLLQTSYSAPARRATGDRAYELKLGTNSGGIVTHTTTTVVSDFDGKDAEAMSPASGSFQSKEPVGRGGYFAGEAR